MKKLVTILIILTFVIMGLFGLFGSKKYISEAALKSSLAKQSEMNSQTLDQLRNYGVTSDSKLKLEFFFYTNEQDKASNLSIDLKEIGYEIETVDKAANEDKLWVISGWTTEIKMDISSVTDWTTKMCKVGFEHDCEFDGWGTNPDQGDFRIEEGLTVQQYYDKGVEFSEQSQLRKSEAYLTRAIELQENNNPLPYYSRAFIKANLQKSQEAIDDYSKAIEFEPAFSEAFENRGALYDELGNYDEAISDYSRAIKINPKSGIAFLNRGNSNYRNNDKQNACADWRKALELGEDSARERLIEYCK